jgi:hypothetical protein
MSLPTAESVRLVEFFEPRNTPLLLTESGWNTAQREQQTQNLPHRILALESYPIEQSAGPK